MPTFGKMALWAAFLLIQFFPEIGLAEGQTAAEIARPVPAQQFILQELHGKVVLMDFWASWCKPCQESMPWLAHMQNDFEAEGLQVVAVNLDKDWDAAVKLASVLPPGIIIVHDPQGLLAAERNLQGMPSAYVYDRQGQLAFAHVGFHTSEASMRESEIVALLNGISGGLDHQALGEGVSSVQPWQRDLLAAPGMEIDPDPIETALDEHIYFSKEASSGGLGSSGGGCGCN